MVQPEKSKLDVYLEEACHRHNPNDEFDALVASEATFSAGGRVIDKYRASLVPTTVNFGCNKRNGELLRWQKDGELWNGSMIGQLWNAVEMESFWSPDLGVWDALRGGFP
ncbi:hypothetical protein ZIOFF_072395 [Zingiber officinale]|uniref:Uncharacterized protein n=1 Tax=Zingiber officinale TaxID=94328 RepID=A0A8J5BYR0_ZINOF|nr:hypothetical protein ZIOFF_072395 [Zingiber officinale]